jgi:hypothetical protein
MRKKYSKQILLLLSFALIALVYTGCRNSGSNMNGDGENQTTAGAQEDTTGTAGEESGSTQDDQGGILDDMGDAAEDVADGVGNAVEDMTGIDYSDYDSANEYLMGQIGTGGQYEVRNEDRELKNYDSTDSSKMGYRYEVYDTAGNGSSPYGVFYVDQQTGKIYREKKSGSGVEEYRQNGENQ